RFPASRVGGKGVWRLFLIRSTLTGKSLETKQIELAEFERPALEDALEARGLERFRARQIFRWIYRRGITAFDEMTDLSRPLRATLTADFTLTTPEIVARERSIDGTEKFLLKLADLRQIESVF